jgi:transcriptional regulator with XRE-family HTH domain
MIELPIDTGAKLKAARKALDFSLTDMAEALRLAGSLDNARTFVREMEDGKRAISGPIQVAVEGMLREAGR